MADPRGFLRDRGLGDAVDAAPAVPPFPFGPDGAPVTAAVDPAAPDMPDDYAARVLALELACRGPVGDALDLARQFHAFLTATEKPPLKREVFTDA
jgi:hypothetical protein